MISLKSPYSPKSALPYVLFIYSFFAPFQAHSQEPGPLDPALRQLIENGYYWEDRGQWGNARQIWTRLLQTDSDEPHALTELGIHEAQEGQKKKAGEYLDRLEKAHPGNPGIDDIKKAIKAGKLDPRLLRKARESVRKGHYEEAGRYYRAYFNGQQPYGSIAFEYAQTLSATRSGHNLGMLQLEHLAKNHPIDARYQLAWAQSLIAREKTRRQGIRFLDDFYSKTGIENRSKTLKLWQEGLLWLNAEPLDKPLFSDYLSVVPSDRLIAKKMKDLPIHQYRILGFSALDANHLQEAENEFRKALLIDPRDAASYYGMSILRLRQGKYSESLSLSRKAIALAPLNTGKWSPMEKIAEYLFLVQQGKMLEARGKTRLALADFRKASRLFPERNEALLAEAHLYKTRGQEEGARKIDLTLIRQSPPNPVAYEQLIRIDLDTGRYIEAQKLVSQTPNFFPDTTVHRIRAFWSDDLGQRAFAEGDIGTAILNFRMAHRYLPEDPWISYHLALALADSGQKKSALRQVTQFVLLHPHSAEGLYARSLIEYHLNEPGASLRSLSKIPLSQRTPAMQLHARLVFSDLFASRAISLAKNGKDNQSLSWFSLSYLLKHDRTGKNVPAFWIRVARVFARNGNASGAMNAYEKAIQLSPNNLPLIEEASGWALKFKKQTIARNWIRQGLSIAPTNPILLEREGDLASSERRFRSAFRDYRKALDSLSTGKDTTQKTRLARKIASARKTLETIETVTPFMEGMAGVTNYSQNSLFTYGEIGVLIPLSGKPKTDEELLNPRKLRWMLHVFLMGSWFAYSFPGSPLQPVASNGLINQSFEELNPAIGLRALYPGGFVDIAAGPAFAQVFETFLPPTIDTGAYVQAEWYQNVGLGNLDVFTNYLGFLDYFYGQARYLYPVGKETHSGFPLVFLGPEAVGQGNYSYNAWQAGVALALPVPAMNGTVLIDGGALRSNNSVGWGGYEGLSLYFRIPL
ncbi:MAG: tetratricopeptide repeat protein [Leptospirales bacterium]